MKNLGYGEGYRYAHTDYADMDAEGDLPPAVALQSNLPEALGDRTYFDPTKQGDEARLRAWIDARRGSSRELTKRPLRRRLTAHDMLSRR